MSEVKEAEIADTTQLGDEWRGYDLASKVEFKVETFAVENPPIVHVGKLELRPIEGSSRPSAVEVFIDGVKQKGVKRLQLNLGVDQATTLVMERVLEVLEMS
jgi:hypothetical protein